MDSKNAAYHRKEQILSDSSSRLNNLLRGNHGDSDEAPEPRDIPANMDEGDHTTYYKAPPMETPPEPATEAEEVIVEDDPNKVRLRGYIQIQLYLFSLLFGAFICYYRHHEHLTDYYPVFLHNFFKILKSQGVHKLSDRLFKSWQVVPDLKKKKFIKYMSYGTVGISLYPVLTAPKKPRKPETPEQKSLREANQRRNQNFINVATTCLRIFSASLVCGLLGYDLAYNWNYLKTILTKN